MIKCDNKKYQANREEIIKILQKEYGLKYGGSMDNIPWVHIQELPPKTMASILNSVEHIAKHRIGVILYELSENLKY